MAKSSEGANPGGPVDRYAGGPLPRSTVPVCDWPDESTQPICTLSPGWWLTSNPEMLAAESTLWPSRDVITSPVVSPAFAAGPPDTTPLTVAPPLLDPPFDPLCESPPNRLPAPPWLLLSLLPEDSSTPRKAVSPTWVVSVPLPDSIWLTVFMASLMGMA